MISCAGALLFVLSVAHGAGQAATNYVELIQSDRPAAYWRCDASGSSEHAAVNSGTVSKVAIGATYRGEVEFVEGLPGTSGKAAKFNGRIAHIHVPKVNALRLDTLSIEFWFKSTQKFENTFWPGSAAFVTIATSGDGSSDFTINAASTRQGDDQGRLLFPLDPRAPVTTICSIRRRVTG